MKESTYVFSHHPARTTFKEVSGYPKHRTRSSQTFLKWNPTLLELDGEFASMVALDKTL